MWLHHSYYEMYKTIATKVFKSLNDLNPTFMNQMLKAKTISYDLGNSNVLFQPKSRKVIYGEHTLKFFRSQRVCLI